MSGATIVHDTSEAVALCPALGLYLKPITKVTISVALPPLRQPGKSISNWEVMERLKAMAAAQARAQFSALRIAKSTLDFIRFEAEVENRALVRPFLACLDGKTIKLSGFADALRVRAAEFRLDFPTRHDWDSFFRDASDMDEALPGERPDTIHLEGLPCRWFAPRSGAGAAAAAAGAPDAASGSASASASGLAASERPSEALLRQAFRTFGDIRHVDIPMLDPYREEMTGRSFHTFSFGGHLNFEAYVQYREYAGFIRAMTALRGMKLMFKGDDGKAVACNIKVTFDSTKHLSDASIRKRQLERQKLQELELQREEQKRREKEAEERRRQEERRAREAEEQERARRRGEKLRRREERARAREQRRRRRRAEKLQQEEQRRLQGRIRAEERKLLLAQRNLQSLRLVAELLGRAEAARRRQHQDERRRLQEAELARVEREKRRALGLQRRERELRQRLLTLLLSRGAARAATQGPRDPALPAGPAPADAPADALLGPVLDMLQGVAARARPAPGGPAPPQAPPTGPAQEERDAQAAGEEPRADPGAGQGLAPPAKPGSDPAVTSVPPTPPTPVTSSRREDTARGGDDDRGDREPEPGREQHRKGGAGSRSGSRPGSDAEEETEAPRRHRADRERERRRSRHRRGGDHARSRSPRSPRRRRSAWSR